MNFTYQLLKIYSACIKIASVHNIILMNYIPRYKELEKGPENLERIYLYSNSFKNYWYASLNGDSCLLQLSYMYYGICITLRSLFLE